MVIRLQATLLLVLALASLVSACTSGDDGAAVPTPTARAVTAPSTSVTGPTATLDPRNGPPGTELTVTGAGWPARATLTVSAENAGTAAAYATVTTSDDGAFTTRFRIEKQPNGAELQTGRFNLVARSSTTAIVLPFQVETRRPVEGPGPGGG